ncbi:MAG: hypothetical protein ACK55Z_01270 [bacterium]
MPAEWPSKRGKKPKRGKKSEQKQMRQLQAGAALQAVATDAPAVSVTLRGRG